MSAFKILTETIGVKLFEWKLQYVPHIVRVMYGTDYKTITSDVVTTSLYSSKDFSFSSLSSWPHTWTDDIATSRTPLLVFELMFDSDSKQSPSWYGIYGISILFWMELVTIQLLICLFAALPLAVLMYYIIIVPQKQERKSLTTSSKHTKHDNKPPTNRTTVLGYFLGWLILLPIWIILPSPMATVFGIDNSLHRFFVCGTTPTIAIFRTLEAMYGFAPSHATTSVYNYTLYFTSPLLLNPKTPPKTTHHHHHHHHKPAWFSSLYHQIVTFITGLFITGLYQSYIREIMPYGQGPASTPSNLYTWSSLFDLQRWYETILYAFLLQFYLSTCSAGLAVSTMILTGYSTQPISDAPLQHCSSPTDFWGRRWNNLIHTCLKNGVFKPIRSLGGHTVLAVLATFIASGLFHEWLLPSTMTDYPHTHGLAITFFLWNAMLVAMEMMIGARMKRWCSGITPYIPRPCITMAVIALGLPVGHWFVDSYMRSDFFTHGQYCFPMILSIPVPKDTHTGRSIPTLFSFSI